MLGSLSDKGGPYAPLLGLGGLAAGAYGLSGGEHGSLMKNLRTVFSVPAAGASPVAPRSHGATGPGLSLQDAGRHPQLSRFFNPDGSIKIQDALKATDAELQQGAALLSPAAKAELQQKLSTFKPSFGQSLGARAMGIDVEAQRRRVLGLLGTQQKMAAVAPSPVRTWKSYPLGMSAGGRLALGGAMGFGAGQYGQMLHNADADSPEAPLLGGRAAEGVGAGLAAGLGYNAIFAPPDPTVRNEAWEKMTPEQRQTLSGRFSGYQKALESEGAYAGTGHKRVAIPKAVLPEPDLAALGFKKVLVGIPEGGQASFWSWRHPENNYHLHDHGEHWTMHADRHPSVTMAMMAAPTPAARVKALARGVTHVVTEGVPGGYLYARNMARRATGQAVPGMVGAVAKENPAAILAGA